MSIIRDTTSKAKRQNTEPRGQRLSRGDMWKFLAKWLTVAAEDSTMLKNDLRVGIIIAVHGQMPKSASAYMENGKLECWPAIDTIARRLSLSRSTVKRAVRRLTDAGLISVTTRRGRELTNVYRLVLPDTEKQVETGEVKQAKTGHNDPVKQVVHGDPQYPTKSREKKRVRAQERSAAPFVGTDALLRHTKEDLTAAQLVQIVEDDPQLSVERMKSLAAQYSYMSPQELLAEIRSELDEEPDDHEPSQEVVNQHLSGGGLSSTSRADSFQDEYDDDDDEPEDLYEKLKEQMWGMSRASFLGLLGENRPQLTRGEYRGLKNMANRELVMKGKRNLKRPNWRDRMMMMKRKRT